MVDHLKGVKFSVWTADEIRKVSVCKVTEKKTNEKGIPLKNGLRDERMGPFQGLCVTCNLRKGKCPGHYGHIELEEYVFHISWVTNVIHWLKCICFHCGEIIIKDIDPNKLNVPRNRIMQMYVRNLHSKCPNCKERQPKYTWNKDNQTILKNGELYENHSIVCHLSNVSSERIVEMDMSHPKDMMLKVLPVPPPNVRPPIMAGNAIRGEDDLTYRLLQIIRLNAKLKKNKENGRPSHVITNSREALQMAVTGYINHKKLSNTRKRSSKREYTSLTAKLTSKEGRIRGNLMGKRCDFTARSVITGDDHLGMHQVGIPYSVAEKLTIPVKVTDYNKKNLQEMLHKMDSPVKFVIRPNGSRVDLSYVNRNTITLHAGFTIERKLQDGDIVLFNRQPSLHKMSIMAHEAKLLPYSTFRMNLSCTTPYNADFDGDEMNVHAPQTVESQAEARNIMAVKYQVVSPQSNRPVMSVIQDALVGAYLLSAPDTTLTSSQFMQCVLDIPDWNGEFERKDSYTGKDLISMVLPIVNWKGSGVEILKGKLIKGQLNKKVLGTSHGSLIHVIYNDCGPDETLLFIHRLQMVVHRYLTIRGFSIGISDMMTPQYIRDTVHKERTQAFKDTVNEKDESLVNQRLNICRDSMGKLVLDPLNDKNRLYCTVNSGSKGSTINISQIMAVVGQQNLCGQRIPKTWTNRTLPHFPKGSDGPLERGFVQHSYVEGLSPAEMWYHAIAGREGIIDTACKTSVTGYLQRRFMKALENFKVHWDGSVRNSGNQMVQFAYGDDGFDPMRVEKQIIDTYNYPNEMSYGGISEEYKQILKDHYYLQEVDKWKDPGLQNSCYYMLPINVSRIVHNTKTLFGFPSRKVTQQEVYEAVSNLVDDIDNVMMKILIRCVLNSQKMVGIHKCTKDNLEMITHEVRKQYGMVKAVAGESCGAIAAQSIGEPATQMTLNTFHFAGVSSKNVTLGVPRLEEIINCTKSDKLKSPMTTITADNMSDIVKQMRHIRIEDLVHHYIITDSPDKDEVAFFHLFPDAEYNPAGGKTLVLYLNEWYDTISLKELIYNTGKLVCAYTDGPKAIFHITSNETYPNLDIGMYYEQNLKGLTVRGVPGAEYTKIVKYPGKPKCIETSLSDLSKLFMYNIHSGSCFTNDIHSVSRTLGIEAARATIIKEIRSILSYYGIYVNIRHILLLVDFMTNNGVLTPLTRHGIRQVDASPLKRSTFEEVVDVFNQAACYNEKDMLDGVSECIIAGVPPNIGSNFNDCLLDKVVEREHGLPRPVTPKTKDTFVFEDNEDDEPWIKMDDPFVGVSNSNPFVGGGGSNAGGFNANAFGTMGGMAAVPTNPFGMMGGMDGNMITAPIIPQTTPWQMPQGQPMWSQPTNVFDVPQMNPPPQVTLPTFGPSFTPTSPTYDPNKPLSPEYHPPISPQYDPNQPMPLSPPYSPTSPAYAANLNDPAYDPTSSTMVIDSPKSPPYSPTSPAYSPPESPMSPRYSPTAPGLQAPAYDPMAYQKSSPLLGKRKTFLE